MNFKPFSILIGMLVLFLNLSAQEAILKGTITDDKTGETLIGVSVEVPGVTGVNTDLNGYYELNLPAGTHDIVYSYIGYAKVRITVTLRKKSELQKDIELKEEAEQLDIVVVSGSRYEKKIGEETMTVDVISSELINNTNAVELSEAVQKTPGLNVIDGQASIRAGSGFSYGIGSRVAIVVDDQPLLDGILGDARWKFVAVENAEQIEVIKGPASVLYGSGALNGLIHVRTGYAGNETQTKFNFFSSVTANPKTLYRRWWDRYDQPFESGASFSHRQRFKNLDVVTGANLNLKKSYLESGDEFRFRGNVKTRYRSPKKEGLSFGLNANIMYEQSQRFFLWLDADTGAYRVGEGGEDQYLLTTLDPHLTKFDKVGNRHTFRSRYYQTLRFGRGDTPSAISNQFNVDYQYQRRFPIGITITTGTTMNGSVNKSNLFDGRRKTLFAGVFGQLEYKWRKLNILGGLREEINRVNDPSADILLFEATNPVFRMGFNQQVGEVTYIRGAFGQSFRFPSIGERFVDANLGALLQIVPNPDLQPEKGWAIEIALKQGLKIGKWLGYFDFSVFWMQYKDFIEYQIVPSPNPAVTLGFRPTNLTDSRVAGYEASLIGRGKIGKVEVNTLIGYTYSYPGDLDKAPEQRDAGEFIKNMFGLMFTSLDSPDEDRVKILKYRNMHIVRGDIQFGYKRFELGYSIYYNSYLVNYDPILEIAGISSYIEERVDKNGDVIMDARFAAKIGDRTKLSFIVKNLTNLEYANRPGIMNSPMSFTLRYSYTLK